MAEEVDLVRSAAMSIDRRLNAIAGIKIAEPVLDTLEEIAPANVIHDITGIPKPSEVMEDVRRRIMGTLPRFRR